MGSLFKKSSQPVPVSPGGQAGSKPVEGGSTPPAGANLGDRVLGLDVAKYQYKMDASEWKRCFDMGYRFVFAKATDGEVGKDPYYQLHRRLSKQAGFLFGGYHFLRYGYDAAKQAKHHYNTAGRVDGELPSVLDVEWDRYTLGQKYGEGKRMDSWAEKHVREYVEELMHLNGGRKPIIYTNAYFWPKKASFPDFWKQFLVWVPSYADSLNPGGKKRLHEMSIADIRMAGVKVKVQDPWKQWDIWQDDDDLSVGDVKAIDTNVFRGSIEDLKNLCK